MEQTPEDRHQIKLQDNQTFAFCLFTKCCLWVTAEQVWLPNYWDVNYMYNIFIYNSEELNAKYTSSHSD